MANIETWHEQENDDMSCGTVHADYWMARDNDTGLEMPGETEAEAIKNLIGNLSNK